MSETPHRTDAAALHPNTRLRPVIRVFVSSTFSDMRHERNALQEHVYPKLELLCQKNGFQFQAIDLRWGVSSEAGLDHRTMRICFDELRRAQEVSPRPNFLILLGNRYGWRPLPEEISVEEFQAMERVAAQVGDAGGKPAVAVLREWYRQDENAVPPVYVLQSRRQDLSDRTDYTDPTHWGAVQVVLWEIINRAMPPAGLHVRFSELGVADALPPIVRFQTSATEQEIWQGALRVPDASEHVLTCFREIGNIGEFSGPGEIATIKDFVDIVPSGGVGTSLYAEQERLKSELRVRLGSADVFGGQPARLVTVPDREGRPVVDVSTDHLTQLCADVEMRFTEIIQGQIDQYWQQTKPGSAERARRELEIEQQEHARASQERGGADTFVGRETELKKIHYYLNNDSTSPLVVHGASGCGKTALMARAAQAAQEATAGFRFQGRKKTKPGTKNAPIIITRFIGVTPRSSDLRGLLNSLCQELRLRWPREGELPTDIKLLEVELHEQFKAGTAEQPLIIFLDALDQLADTDGGRLLHWIPGGPLPAHVKIVVSCLSDRAAKDPAGQPYAELKRRQLPAAQFVNLDALSEADARTLLFERWLPQAGRTVSGDQRTRIEQRLASEACRQPIFLKLLFEEARLWRSYDTAPHLGEGVTALLTQLFDRLSQKTNHGQLLVERVLGYLAASREGLAENEILEILFRDPEYKTALDDATKGTSHEMPPNATRIPIAIWSRLRFDLSSYLTERGATGANVLTFYHRQVAEWAHEHFAKEPDQRWRPHQLLADYFVGCAQGANPAKRWETLAVRGFAECVFHLTEAGKHEQAVGLLSSFPFLLHKLRVGLLEGVFEDYNGVRHEAPPEVVRRLDLWNNFFREKAHILRRGNDEWPVHKVLLQLAIEHADDSPLSLGAEQWLADGRCDWTWLRRNQRLPHTQVSPCLAVLEGHSNPVVGALVLPDGGIISWSWDGTLRLWDREGPCLAVLDGHSSGVNGALLLPDGRVISWCDHTPRLWDRQSGQCLAILEGHSGSVFGTLGLTDGRILSWSSDHTLRLWDSQTARCLIVLEGHSEAVGSALVLPDGRIVSWSYDKTLRLWDSQTGKCLAILEGHSESANGALVLPGGLLLSWSWDGTLRVWVGHSGQCLAVLEGHSRTICGALVLPNGLLLSWSWDGTLRLWDSQTGKCLAVLEGHSGFVCGALVLPNGRILSWSDDNTLRIWDSQTGKCVAILEGHSDGVNGALVLPDGRILSWSGDKTLRLWDNETGKCLAVLEGHSRWVWGTLVLPDGRILSWSGDKTLRLWDSETGKCLAVLEGHSRTICGTQVLPDGRLFSWSYDKTLRLWDSQMGKCLAVLEGHSESANGGLVLPDGRLFSWSWDGTLRLWDSQTGKCLAVLEGHSGPINGALVLPDGRILSWAGGFMSRDYTLRMWDNVSGQCLAVLEGHSNDVYGALVLPDGRLLSWSLDNTLRLWDSQMGKCLAVLEGHSGGVWGALALADGRILSWARDNTLRLWDSQMGKCLAVLEGHSDAVWRALVLPDGRILSWAWGESRTWNRNGNPIAVHSIDEGLRLFPEFRSAYHGKDRNLSRCLWDQRTNVGLLRLSGKVAETDFHWHGDSECTARHLLPEGRAILTQDNGQVCFLQLHHGNRRISIAELEAMYPAECVSWPQQTAASVRASPRTAGRPRASDAVQVR